MADSVCNQEIIIKKNNETLEGSYMIESLTDLYLKYWDEYVKYIKDNQSLDPAEPYLLKPTYEYMKSSKKIMVFGQETYGWGRKDISNNNPEDVIASLMSVYDNFANRGGYSSPYWQFLNKLRCYCKDFGFIYNNIVKIGKCNEVGCDDTINELTLKYFPVIREELNILKPDVLLFLTGFRYYLVQIEKVFGKFELIELNSEQGIKGLRFENKEYPKAFICNHPKYLRFRKMFDSGLRFLCNKINEI